MQTPNTSIFQASYGLPNIEGKVLRRITWKKRPHHNSHFNCITPSITRAEEKRSWIYNTRQHTQLIYATYISHLHGLSLVTEIVTLLHFCIHAHAVCVCVMKQTAVGSNLQRSASCNLCYWRPCLVSINWVFVDHWRVTFRSFQIF
jgi:hypothetical protein